VRSLVTKNTQDFEFVALFLGKNKGPVSSPICGVTFRVIIDPKFSAILPINRLSFSVLCVGFLYYPRLNFE
jgi:hypothetical protein